MIFKFKIELNLIDMTHILPMKSSESKISLSFKSYDRKSAENDQDCYVAEKCIVSNNTNFNSTNWRLE